MNTLRIKLNPYKDINIASLNDKPLSPYSELNNYMKEPFLNWASKLLEAAEREINDDYSLIVTSESFERLFIEGLQNDFDSCKEYVSESFQLDTSISERFNLIRNLAAKYGISYSVDEHKLPLYTEIRLSLDGALVDSVNIENAKLIVSDNEEILRRIRTDVSGLIVVLLSDKNVVSVIGNGSYLWRIAASDLDTVLNSIVDRYVKIPVIVKVASLLKNVADKMNTEDSKNLSLATEIDPFISISEIEDIEVGETVTLGIRVFPEGSEMPKLRLVPQNESVIAVDGLNIMAIAPGNTCIDIYRAEENIPFARKSVTAFQNNFVKRIDLRVSSDTMGIGRSQNAIIDLFPADADDAGSVEWTVDNPNVVKVDRNGVITARKEGKAKVTAYTEIASASVKLTVLPNIKSMISTVSQTTLYVGQTQPISVRIAPDNCFDPSYEWISSDKSVAVVEKQADGNTVIRATGIGTCTLTCTAKEGGCSTGCTVTVESTFKKRENSHGMLSLTAILAVAAVFCAVFGVSAVVVIVAIATTICGVIAMVKNKSDRFWAFLLAAIAIFLALESLGIINIF